MFRSTLAIIRKCSCFYTPILNLKYRYTTSRDKGETTSRDKVQNTEVEEI
jgi:hypothetical protein